MSGALPPEEWRGLDWLPGYEISESGRLRRTTDAWCRPAGTISTGMIRGGYHGYSVTLNKRNVLFYTHRLVCEAWHGPPFEGAHCAHWDGDKRNNHYTNLRWATPAENSADGRRLGRNCAGERHPNAKLTWAAVAEIRASPRLRSAVLAARFQVSRETINRARRGFQWKEA